MTSSIELIVANSSESFSVRTLSAHERMSGLMNLSVVALSPNPSIDLDSLVMADVTVRFHGEQVTRTWHGLCNEATQTQSEDSSGGLSTYSIHVVPHFWRLSQRRNHRIFQHSSIPDIVRRLLDEWHVTHRMAIETAAYARLDYCVQYGESDFDFVSRLLERAGISYCFENAGPTETRVVFADHPEAAPMREPIPFVDSPNLASRKKYVSRVSLGRKVVPRALALGDYDFRRPEHHLESRIDRGDSGEALLSRVRWEPGHALRELASGDGLTPVADDKGAARHDDEYGRTMAEIALDAARVPGNPLAMHTNVVDLVPGTVFAVDEHPHADLAGERRLLVLDLRSEISVHGDCHLTVQAVFADRPFRPAQRTATPRIAGVQSAMVVGPPGQEIHTDEFGRVRVKFHWDRLGAHDDHATCFLRVSQAWAGMGFGSTLIPRVGDEVIVDFLEGNPDRPVVVGRLYNGSSRQPYELPANKTRSSWKTHSTPGDPTAFSEIMLEDAAGSELVYVQAERDLRKLVKHDETERCGGDHTQIIGGSRVGVVRETESTEVGSKRIVRMIEPGDLAVLEQGQPQIAPTSTFFEMADEKVTITTGDVTISLDGPDITLSGRDAIRFTAEGEVVVRGGPDVFLNEQPAAVLQAGDPALAAKTAAAAPDGRVLSAVLSWLEG